MDETKARLAQILGGSYEAMSDTIQSDNLSEITSVMTNQLNPESILKYMVNTAITYDAAFKDEKPKGEYNEVVVGF